MMVVVVVMVVMLQAANILAAATAAAAAAAAANQAVMTARIQAVRALIVALVVRTCVLFFVGPICNSYTLQPHVALEHAGGAHHCLALSAEAAQRNNCW